MLKDYLSGCVKKMMYNANSAYLTITLIVLWYNNITWSIVKKKEWCEVIGGVLRIVRE